jgi:hypothetical protein
VTRLLLLILALPAAAANVLYVDCNGDGPHPAAPWGTDAQRADVLARVADKYSPFNVLVTATKPNHADHVATIYVGGNGAWTGQALGGVNGSGVGSFATGGFGYVFPDNLQGGVKDVGEAAAHEAGHVLGLSHQITLLGGPNYLPYNPGDAAWAPVMGNSYHAARSGWAKGPSDVAFLLDGSGNLIDFEQDDIAVLTKALGTAADTDHVIETTADVDTFPVHGPASLIATSGGMLDLKLSVWDQTGRLVQTVNDAVADERVTLPAGDWMVGVASAGAYGDVGGYTVAVAPVGEPGTALLLCGAVVVGCQRRRTINSRPVSKP